VRSVEQQQRLPKAWRVMLALQFAAASRRGHITTRFQTGDAMAETLLLDLPFLDELERRDIERLVERPFPCWLFMDRQAVLCKLEEVPAAFATTIRKLKGRAS
jgi:hypothetical protein